MKPSRRWFQYSLRSFLAVLTALAVWLGIVVNRAREQREAVEAIEAISDRTQITYDWQLDWTPDKYLPNPHGNPGGQIAAPTWLRRIVGNDFFQEVQAVTLWNVSSGLDRWNREAIPHLKRLRGLRVIQVYYGTEDTRNELKAALPACDVWIYTF